MSINILQKYGVFLHLLRYFSFSIYSFIYFWKLWLCWVFAALCGFSSRVRAPGGQVSGATAHRLWFWCIGLIVLSIPYPLPVFFAINQSFLGLERPPLLSCSFYHITFLFFFPFIFISWRLITLQYCSGWHESAMDLHVLPMLIPPPASHPRYHIS